MKTKTDNLISKMSHLILRMIHASLSLTKITAKMLTFASLTYFIFATIMIEKITPSVSAYVSSIGILIIWLTVKSISKATQFIKKKA